MTDERAEQNPEAPDPQSRRIFSSQVSEEAPAELELPGAKDLIVDLFGDYIRYLGSEIKLGHLNELMADFGVEPATTRVTISRMRKDGWFTTTRTGREMIYRPTTSMVQMLDVGRERIFQDTSPAWTGRWTLLHADISTLDRVEQKALVRDLVWEGFAAYESGLWISARDNREDVRSLVEGRGVTDQDVFTSWTGLLERDREIARRYWDLETLDDLYRQFINNWQRQLCGRTDSPGPEEALRLRVTLINNYRKFLFPDPHLPSALLPAGWSGHEARNLFITAHHDLAGPAMARVSEIMFRADQ